MGPSACQASALPLWAMACSKAGKTFLLFSLQARRALKATPTRRQRNLSRPGNSKVKGTQPTANTTPSDSPKTHSRENCSSTICKINSVTHSSSIGQLIPCGAGRTLLFSLPQEGLGSPQTPLSTGQRSPTHPCTCNE